MSTSGFHRPAVRREAFAPMLALSLPGCAATTPSPATAQSFDGFPVFSPDGRYLVFASNRNGSAPGETNIFRAEWVEHP